MVNLGVVGCGTWGINYVRVFNEIPGSKVAIVCDSSAERLRLVCERYHLVGTTTELAELLTNKWIDAVVVATPANTHFAVARECLAAGKHVLVEKPMATSIADAEALVDLAQRQNRVLMVGHTFLYNAGIRMVKELISGDRFGQVYYLHATRTNMGPIRPDVNSLWDLASHDVAIFNYLLDSQPHWVSAVGLKALQNERADVGFVTLSYPGGIIANAHNSWIDPNKVRETVIVGSRQRIVFDDLKNLERVRIFERGIRHEEMEADGFGEFRLLIHDGAIISPWIEASEPLRNLGLHFVDCVTSGRQPLTDGQNGLEVVRILSAMDESLARNGAPVELTRGERMAV